MSPEFARPAPLETLFELVQRVGIEAFTREHGDPVPPARYRPPSTSLLGDRPPTTAVSVRGSLTDTHWLVSPTGSWCLV